MTEMHGISGRISRRKVLAGLGAAGVAAALPCPAYAQNAPARVVIVGGGTGGATVASALRRQAPDIAVTLIEPKEYYTTSFLSNAYFANLRSLDQLRHSYDGLKRLGVTLIRDIAVDADAVRKTVTLRSGTKIPYDGLVLSPGFDFKYEAIEGYGRETPEVMPHAWRAGPQTELLRRQIEAMPDNGTVVIAVPGDPFVCPPAPYERACMIASFLKGKKPQAKVLVLDAKVSIPMQTVFMEAVQKYYSGMIEINLSNELADFSVQSIDPATKTIITKSGDKFTPDVANVIPPQRAGGIARRLGCAEGDWCPVDPLTFASSKIAGGSVYLLGDSAVASDMPKSAYAANSQGKLVANAIAAEFVPGRKLYPRRLRNTCWALVAPGDSIKIGATYEVQEKGGKKRLVALDGFVSETGEDVTEREKNYKESFGWYSAITAEMFYGV